MSLQPINSSTLLKAQVHDIEGRLSSTTIGQRSGYYWFIVVLRGKGDVTTKELKFNLGPKQVCWVPMDNQAEVTFSAATRAFLIALPPEVYAKTLPDGAPGDDLQLYLQQPLTQDGLDGASLGLIETHIKAIGEEIYNPQPGEEQILTHLFALIFIHLWRSLHKGDVARPVPLSVVDRFFALEKHHRMEHLSVGEYAARIGVTRDRLGAEVRRATNLSPRGYLHQELVREACELLKMSSLQVAQIAYRLGFSEPGYFNRFFLRHVGQTPGRYRRQFRRFQQKAPNTFAEWP